MSDSSHDAHTGPIKTPKQLLLTVIFAFVVPVFVIIGLVYYVATESKPSGSTLAEAQALGGLTADDLDRGIAQRIAKVGSVQIGADTNRPLRAGEEVYKAQCSACHATGVSGAPKFADAGAWGPRIGTGFNALVQSALKGKNAMPAQGGGDFNDVEIARAVAYMANAGGAKFAEPAAPAGEGGAAASAPAAAGAAAAPAATTAAGGGEALYNQTCATCHAAGIAGAPKLGDKAGWAPRLQQGLDTLVKNAINGKNAMPPRGGSSASDAEIRAAVEYMTAASK